MPDKHDPFGPSRLAQWEHCCHWDGEQNTDAAKRGTDFHKLIADLASGNGAVCEVEDLERAQRCLGWLQTILPGVWKHECWVDGAVPETGGTIDACMVRANMIYIVDWKASDVSPDSLQGKAYALNLWEQHPDVIMVRVYFYNYNTHQYFSAQYQNKSTLRADVERIVATRKNLSAPPSVHAGCAYCVKRANCSALHKDTVSTLSTANDMRGLSVQAQVELWTKLKKVMKRAESLEKALEASIKTATIAGENTGMRVIKKGTPRRWTVDTIEHEAQAYADAHFLPACSLVELVVPKEAENRLVAAWGESHRESINRMIDGCSKRTYYTMLMKGKDNG
jgi:hypothetical protein